ncbi:PPOX class F420-dependent oxidoreductase [Rudaeicoccus suwonensis]|uniref:PPOX class probable F420-dependent enzyme n=1 Tax=Rudaeicoccus suwonensis TaxID=657409 RepID=A0A561E7C2_9MICO|nr:PPOX class F420-dependent oxidoreductase [Rudaeicoccus suwonensis]TWE11513.1 PPOX class probable F420-dependent enzyme [Rudaeicoccus suwonensis]
MTSAALRALISDNKLAVLATIRRDGRPQLSNVSYCYDRDRDLIRVSITDDRAKTANLRRDPRATVLVSDTSGWSYAAADADATLLPVCTSPDDASADELVDIYRNIAGEHDDWAEYRQAMVDDRRVPLLLRLTHVYGAAR